MFRMKTEECKSGPTINWMAKIRLARFNFIRFRNFSLTEWMNQEKQKKNP